MSIFTTTGGHPLTAAVITDTVGNAIGSDDTDGTAVLTVKNRNYVWDASGLQWVRQGQTSGSGNVFVSGGADIGSTGSPVPPSASYHGINVGGNLRGMTGVNPSGSVYALQVDLTSMNNTTLGAALPTTSNQGTGTGPSSSWKSSDDYQGGEVLADQSGSGSVLTYTFSQQVSMVVMESVGANVTARADPFGGTPTSTKGVLLQDSVPVYVPVQATTVKVFTPSGSTVTVFGLTRS